jgi:proline iminopeptidase
LRVSALLLLVVGQLGCDLHTTDEVGALVPPTAEQDPALPQEPLTVAGRRRAVHLRTFGDTTRPVLLVLHGGPAADFRLMLPLAALADRYFVVMWDQRGAGLSEQVSSPELALDTFDEEIAAVKARFAPQQRVTLMGHSFGGSLATRFAARPDGAADIQATQVS